MAGARHGGAEAFFERLAPALHRAGVSQRLAIRRNPRRAAALRAAGVETHELSFGGFFDFTTRAALRRIITAYKPKVVLSWMSRATKLCPSGDFVHVARLGGYYDLKYYKHCDHLVGNTRGIVEYIRAQGWPAERAHYLPNFVSIEPAPPLPRAACATPGDAPLLLALGRLHRNKGFDVLLESLAKLPGFYLWIAGEGPERAVLESRAQALGVANRVRFLGWRTDISALLAAADLFVCSSRVEPLGNIVIEAWAAGIPVIAAAAAGPSELIEDGETGLLIPLENPDAMAHAIRALYGDSDLRAHLKSAGRRAYENSFSESKVVAEYKNFFNRIART